MNRSATGDRFGKAAFRLGETLMMLESGGGALLASFIGMIVVTGPLIAIPDVVPGEMLSPGSMALILLSVVIGVVQVMLLLRMWSALFQEEIPLAPILAWRQPSWPVWFRPVVALFWLAHSAAGVLGVVVWGSMRTEESHPALLAFGFVFLSLATYSAYLYLLMAVMACVRSERALRIMWKQRWMFSTGVAVLAVLMPRTWW